MSSGPLTNFETVLLGRCEKVIQEGLKTFVDVGEALMTIRGQLLYRTTHSNFEEYCKEKWGMAKSHSHRLMQSAGVMAILAKHEPEQEKSPRGDLLETQGDSKPQNKEKVLPTTEKQVRPLTKLEPEQQPIAWERAQEIAKEAGEPVKAKHVEEAVREVQTGKREETEQEPEESKTLTKLKELWEKANTHDRKAFWDWANQ